MGSTQMWSSPNIKRTLYIYNMILSQSIYFSMHVRLGITNFGVNAKTWGMNRGDY